nr:hypothetical protein [Alteromonas sp. a30]
MGFDMIEHGDHARSFHEIAAASKIIRKDLFDIIAIMGGMNATTLLLRG